MLDQEEQRVQREQIVQGIACMKHQNMSDLYVGDARKDYLLARQRSMPAAPPTR